MGLGSQRVSSFINSGVRTYKNKKIKISPNVGEARGEQLPVVFICTCEAAHVCLMALVAAWNRGETC